MTIKKSMTDAAFEILSSKKRAILFSKLWQEVSKMTAAPQDKIAEFYSDLTLDGRFAQLKDNKWDLKARRKFAESHIDLSGIEIDNDEGENEYIQEDYTEKALEDDN